MKRKFFRILSAATIPAAAIIATPAHAQIATGNIPVSLTLTSACVIEAKQFITGTPADTRNLDSLAFPATPSVAVTTTVTVDASVAIDYKCSVGITPKLTLDGGSNNDAGLRRMKLGIEDHYVPYRLYRAASQGDEILPNGQLTLTADGSEKSYTIYGTATIPSTAKVGNYTDTIIVTVTL